MRYKTVKFSNPEIDNLLQEVKDGDFDVTVTEDDIDSGEATAGQVLTADGEGGAEFSDPITYESKPAASGGTDVSLVTTGEKYNWNNKQDAITRDQPVDLAMVVGLDSQDNVVTGEVRAVNIDSGNASSGQVLTADGSGNAAWQTPSSGGMSNPMNAAGDIIVGGANGTPTRLGLGTAGQVLKVNDAGTGLEYGAGGSGGGTTLFKHHIKVEDTDPTNEYSWTADIISTVYTEALGYNTLQNVLLNSLSIVITSNMVNGVERITYGPQSALFAKDIDWGLWPIYPDLGSQGHPLTWACNVNWAFAVVTDTVTQL